MFSKKSLIPGLILVVSLILSACDAGQPTPAAPTIDANMIFTQAAQTVMAGLAKTKVSTPTPTDAPKPAQTLPPLPGLPTSPNAANLGTPAVLTALATQATRLPDGTVQPLNTLIPGLVPTATAATGAGAAKPASGDKAEYVGQTPADNAQFKPGAAFAMTWKIKNVGTTTWNQNYMIRFYTGEQMGGGGSINLRETVAPGAYLQMPIQLYAPDALGKHRGMWVLSNPEGFNFSVFDITIETTDNPKQPD